MGDSTLYTIGTALNRARDHDIPVEVLVGGEWLSGQVAAVDGHGVVLTSEGAAHAVVRVEAVTAVKVHGPGPTYASVTGGARPMPGPGASHGEAG